MIVLKPSFADQGTRNSKLGKLSAWTEVARGPYRPMNTTLLKDNVKFQVILDINKYIVKPKGDATLEPPGNGRYFAYICSDWRLRIERLYVQSACTNSYR
ncbi:hypothetical protein CJF30_00011374 [Rutstroemia sp. NJR-2017a BBW]|nr:hypothetical protein CJF30_00011374 [Rutstroemia sp. NJR-2017a BBW]